MELLTAAQMRAVEAAAIASSKVTGLELMERAGQGVVAAILAEWPDLARAPHRAVVLCGPGNNGGDGFVVARLLKARGWDVVVYLDGDPARMPPDARTNFERWRQIGMVGSPDDPVPMGLPVSLIVDALYGIGLARPMISGVLDRMSFGPRETGRRTGRIVSIDIPSGLDADSGRVLGVSSRAVEADLTVTFHRCKPGHVLEAGPWHCGRLAVVDICLDGEADNPAQMVGRPGPGRLAVLGKHSGGHKFTHGHALVLSGPAGHGGAARLAARGALRIGAGLVTIGAPEDALGEHAARLDAVMLRPCDSGADLSDILRDPRIGALCLGPGLGHGERATGLVAAALDAATLGPSRQAGAGDGRTRPALVLDADALTILGREPGLFALLKQAAHAVLTPHGGEFARLFPDISEELAQPATSGPAFSKIDATRKAAARAGCTVLYKGADTVIADPSGACSVNSAHYDRAAPWLATAGSGDVLAGFIAGLMARGFAPKPAAETAAWLHVECARSFGPGLIAEDLPEELPKVLRSVLAGREP
jgi:hydroxyethylthiazole kinase-like uncharacterized protein yjeF